MDGLKAEVSSPPSWDRTVVIALLAMALAGATLSVMLPVGCGGCERAKNALDPLPLAHIGLLFYGVILLSTVRWGITPWVRRAILFAAGLHVMLLSLLLWRQMTCWICIGTAACAISASAYLLIHRTIPLRFAATWAMVGMLAVGGPIAGFMRHRSHIAEREAIAAVREVLRAAPRAGDGQIHLIILTRPGCDRCATFKATILPTLKQNPAVQVDERDAVDVIPTPTVLAHGKRAYTAVGLKSLDHYQRMLVAASGDSGEAPSGLVLLNERE